MQFHGIQYCTEALLLRFVQRKANPVQMLRSQYIYNRPPHCPLPIYVQVFQIAMYVAWGYQKTTSACFALAVHLSVEATSSHNATTIL